MELTHKGSNDTPRLELPVLPRALLASLERLFFLVDRLGSKRNESVDDIPRLFDSLPPSVLLPLNEFVVDDARPIRLDVGVKGVGESTLPKKQSRLGLVDPR